jgi:capsule polysaccharide export protein KpsE/RkpR
LNAPAEVAERPGDGTVPALAVDQSNVTHDSAPMTTAQASATNLMDPTEPLLNRSELEALHAHYREMKHAINNTFAVIMALSELGQRNPAHLEKLAKAVLQRSPEVVNQLTTFGEKLGAKLKEAK